LGARLARLQNQFSDSQLEEIAAIAGQSLPSLTANLFESIDPDVTDRLARERFNISADVEPTEAQLDSVEGDLMTEALSPFLDPQLREAILSAKTLIEQVIDEVTQDELISAGFDAGAKDKAQAILQDFRAFLDDHRDQIEAIQILYSRPYRTGLRYRQVKELAAALQRPPLMLSAPQQQLWKLFEAVEPERVRGKGGKALVDLIAIVRHGLYPDEPLVPVAEVIEVRYQEWLAEQAPFLPDQQAWLDAIKNHIATSLSIEQDDFVETPFAQMGGLGRVYDLFGDRLPSLLDELNDRLAA
jgi:type I restriction enzyme R subunit